jgi:hypothetical protein
MKVFKVIVQLADTSEVSMCDAIEFEGQTWLVPQWFEVPSESKTIPRRIIPLAKLRHQKMSSGNPYGADALVNDPMPKALFDEQIPTELATRYGVVERPDISIPAAGGIH